MDKIRKVIHITHRLHSTTKHLQTNIKKGAVSKKCVILTLKNLSLLLQPFVPHLSEELWKLLGENDMAINQKWPKPLGINKKTSYN